MAKIHRISGYVMLILGNIVVSGGIVTYFSSLNVGAWASLGFLVIVIFIIAIAYTEKRYRTKHSQTYHFDKLRLNWERKMVQYSPEELEYEVGIGTPLVVLD